MEYFYDNTGALIRIKDFNDANHTGWTVYSGQGAWSETDGYTKNTLSTTVNSYIHHPAASGDTEIRFSYYSEDTSSNSYYSRCAIRNNTGNSRVNLMFYPDRARLYEYNGSYDINLANNTSATTAQDTWYDVVVKMSGSTIKVYRAPRGGQMTEILSTTSASVTTSDSIFFMTPSNTVSRYDDLRLWDGGTQSTWTMAHNDTNELIAIINTVQGCDIDFTYDALGRLVSQESGNLLASYTWKWDSLLAGYDTNLPEESSLEFVYDARGQKRLQTSTTSTTLSRWSKSSLLSNETSSGSLVRTNMGDKGYISGADAVTGDAHYLLSDASGTVTQIRSAAKSLIGRAAYDPMGMPTAKQATYFQFEGFEFLEHIQKYDQLNNIYLPATGTRAAPKKNYAGCSQDQIDAIRAGFDEFCKKANTDKFASCMCNIDANKGKRITKSLRNMCKQVDTIQVTCHPKQDGNCGPRVCGWSRPYLKRIHICPVQWSDPGCGPVGCTLLHEMTHILGSRSEEWPENVEGCLGGCPAGR